MFKFLKKKKPVDRADSSYVFHEIGFHGDEYLIALVDDILDKVSVFFETGTNVGTTLAHIASRNTKVQLHSCEPDKRAFDFAVSNTEKYDNATVYNMLSQDFMKMISTEMPEVFEKPSAFWLDAHSYGFKWPLKEEVKFITGSYKNGFILVDDFKVPGLDEFLYDKANRQVCSYDYIKSSIQADKYRLYYPSYTDKTSKHHPLIGWGLIVFGDIADEWSPPADLVARISESTI
jgi:hypothetical protein